MKRRARRLPNSTSRSNRSQRSPATSRRSTRKRGTRKEQRWWTRGRSGIHGQGLFAATDIPRTTRVIEYRGPKLTKAEGWRRANAWLAKTEDSDQGAVYVFEVNSRYDIDGNVPWNPARHINHSCKPNCEPRVIRGRIWIIARRRIRAGEEITYDYGYDLEAWEDHPCRCGHPNCIGYIVAHEHRAKLRRLLARRKNTDDSAKVHRTRRRVARR